MFCIEVQSPCKEEILSSPLQMNIKRNGAIIKMYCLNVIFM
ncbi:MAG: hypothetical protein Q4P18_02260 [Methanobrevibacter sp.]|nr:hypothetical protein [Methanobrevibacter sp.]